MWCCCPDQVSIPGVEFAEFDYVKLTIWNPAPPGVPKRFAVVYLAVSDEILLRSVQVRYHKVRLSQGRVEIFSLIMSRELCIIATRELSVVLVSGLWIIISLFDSQRMILMIVMSIITMCWSIFVVVELQRSRW